MAQTKDYYVIRYGNRNGEIKFGHIWPDNNQSAVLLGTVRILNIIFLWTPKETNIENMVQY